MSVAKAYARALYEAATEGKTPGEAQELCNQIETQLDTMSKVIGSSKEAQIALYGPVTTAKEKVALIQQLTKAAPLAKITQQFLTLLAGKGRLELLPQMKESFSEVRLAAEGGIHGRVVSAEALSDSEIQELASAFGKKYGKRVAFQVSTDPSLLAGMKVTLNGVTYDGSLRSQLQQIKEKFISGLSTK